MSSALSTEDYGHAQLALALVLTPQAAVSSAWGGTPTARCPVRSRFRSEQLLPASETSTGGGVANEAKNRELQRPILSATISRATGVT